MVTVARRDRGTTSVLVVLFAAVLFATWWFGLRDPASSGSTAATDKKSAENSEAALEPASVVAPDLAGPMGPPVVEQRLALVEAVVGASVLVARVTSGGAPAAGATVELHSHSGRPVFSTRANELGEVRVPASELRGAPWDVLAALPGLCNRELVAVPADGRAPVDVALVAVQYAQLVIERSDGTPYDAPTRLRGAHGLSFSLGSGAKLTYSLDIYRRCLKGLAPLERRLLTSAGLPADWNFDNGIAQVLVFDGAQGRVARFFGNLQDPDTSRVPVEFHTAIPSEESAPVRVVLPVVATEFGEVVLRFDESRTGALREAGPATISVAPPMDGDGQAVSGGDFELDLDFEHVEREGSLRLGVPVGEWWFQYVLDDYVYASPITVVNVSAGAPAGVEFKVPDFGSVRVHWNGAFVASAPSRFMSHVLGDRSATSTGRTLKSDTAVLRQRTGSYLFHGDAAGRGYWFTTTGTAPAELEAFVAAQRKGRVESAASALQASSWAADSAPALHLELLDRLAVLVHAGETTDIYLVPRTEDR